MKFSLVALACTALLGATSAMADGRHGDYGRGDHDRHGYDYGKRHGHDGWRDGRDYRHGHNHGHYSDEYSHYEYDRHDRRWGNRPRYGYGGGWHRGGYYQNGGYTVHNYGSYHLRHPGYGYHWVRDGRDYLLVAIATGLIADVVLNGYDY